MSQIEELQSRITAAMERIGAGLTALSEQTPEAAEPDPAVLEQLEEERLANAQLQERLRRIKARHDEALERLNQELQTQIDAMTRLDMDLQRLRQANDQLRNSNAALRKANEEGVGDPQLINKAMLAELDALRASQAADTAEVSAVLSRLEPLLRTATTPAEEEDEV